MPFSLQNWLLRKKITAQVLTSGRPVEHSRIGNPYHAVTIEPGPRACAAARELDGKRYLSTAAPMLPVRGCTMASCRCSYVHHKDRRSPRDRRVNFHNPHAHKMSDRRSGAGRRMSD